MVRKHPTFAKRLRNTVIWLALQPILGALCLLKSAFPKDPE